jgi:protein-L-isoaspartate(D-aspartate) O-methyltransferase
LPREAFLGPPPWTVSSRYGAHRLAGADPVVLYQDLVIALDPARGVNNGSPSLHAKLLEALAPKPGERVFHVGTGAGYYSAILAELVGPSGRVTAVEFDAALAERAKTLLSGRSNVRVVHGDGARWPETPVEGVYVNFAVARPADRWIEGLAAGGRLVFPLGVPGPQRPDSGGRHSDRGAALRIERRGDGYAARAVSTAYFVCAEGEFEADPEEVERLRIAFDAGGLDTVRSLIWKRPALSDRCWFAGKEWALSRDETP